MMRGPRAVSPVLLTVLWLGACGGSPTTPSTPVTILQLSLTPSTVLAGATSEGTATLSGPAPAGGLEVRLSSSDGVAAVPPSIIVPGGSSSVTFNVRTRLVAADTIATISGVAGGGLREAALRVTTPVAGPPSLQALEVEPSVFRGGQNSQGTVRLTGAAPAAGMVIILRSSNPVAIVPNSVTVPAGAISATFIVTTRAVSLDTQFEITASFGDQTRTVPIHLAP
jgi:hypothetical protein